MGGSDALENLVALTPEEHFVAHQLLVKMHPGNAKLVFAALAMTRGRASNKRYGWLRRRFSRRMSEVWKGKKRAPFSEAHRFNIAQAQTGKVRGPHSKEHRAKLAAAHTGKTLTHEHRQKLSAAKQGSVRGTYTIKTCPRCLKTGAGGTMNRWHFDNCKVSHV
jgi:hypothetical protein